MGESRGNYLPSLNSVHYANIAFGSVSIKTGEGGKVRKDSQTRKHFTD